ncbi:response regulator transcription factor [Candidatus Beckwithbacteria bacterium]|nr:response regulator transcription factor [Candidatus Beckwithbacteria bacterium]
MKVLIVEDDHKIAQNIKKGLEQENFSVDLTFDGGQGYDFASQEEYDVIILDLMLPEMSGIEICKKLRAENNHTPILMLTARDQIEDKVLGLNSGADDYLPKPFAFTELLARIKALSRRPKQSLQTKLEFKNLTLDTITYKVERSGREINLSKKEFSLLEYLMRHPRQILNKDQIINNVWNFDADILPNTVEVYIGYLRNKIDKPFSNEPSLIQTIRGFGYKLDEK